MPQAKRTGILTGAILLAVLLAVFAIVILRQAETSKKDIPVYGEVPEFTFVNQDGQPFGLEQMKGKVSVVDFFFTSCRSACPIMSNEMGKLYEAFQGTNDLEFVSISVDPARDSLSVLREYAHDNNVTDDRWQFLHAPQDSVIRLSEQGFKLAADNLPMGHSTRFALVDRSGRIRGYYNALEQKPMIALKGQIRLLLKEPWTPPPAKEQEEIGTVTSDASTGPAETVRG